MDEIDIHLGRRLRRRRRLLGLTQQELAHACGVRFQQIQKYECAANRMSAARLWQLAEALEVPVSYFYEGLTRDQRETLESETASLIDERMGSREAQDLIRAYYQLGERPRRRLLDLAKAMNGEVDGDTLDEIVSDKTLQAA
ncbi:MAG: transcriptional regulator, Cro/CI family [Parcubacteria bacterium C7867-004]|nr:MAG: transcriptional regulator, Cro/CI family [Parcubacteria bacterium C7867-004]